LTACGCPN
jgi:hypothetical protein